MMKTLNHIMKLNENCSTRPKYLSKNHAVNEKTSIALS